jgi:hypothetical protein
MYVGIIHYVSPEGTASEGEEMNTIYVIASESLEVVCDHILDNFDGQETFEDKFRPEIMEFFSDENNKEYFGDDYSAGQWIQITIGNAAVYEMGFKSS